MVEEDADQHLHHFTIEFKRKVMRQDQLREKNRFCFGCFCNCNNGIKGCFLMI